MILANIQTTKYIYLLLTKANVFRLKNILLEINSQKCIRTYTNWKTIYCKKSKNKTKNGRTWLITQNATLLGKTLPYIE